MVLLEFVHIVHRKERYFPLFMDSIFDVCETEVMIGLRIEAGIPAVESQSRLQLKYGGCI
jgi:hypothetical protein